MPRPRPAPIPSAPWRSLTKPSAVRPAPRTPLEARTVAGLAKVLVMVPDAGVSKMQLTEDMSLPEDLSLPQLSRWCQAATTSLQNTTQIDMSDKQLSTQLERRVHQLEPLIAASRAQLQALKQQQQGSVQLLRLQQQQLEAHDASQSTSMQISAVEQQMETSQLQVERWQQIGWERDAEQVSPSSQMETIEATQRELGKELLQAQNMLLSARGDKEITQEIKQELELLEDEMQQNLVCLKHCRADTAARASEDLSPRTALNRAQAEHQAFGVQLCELQMAQVQQAQKAADIAAALRVAGQQRSGENVAVADGQH